MILTRVDIFGGFVIKGVVSLRGVYMRFLVVLCVLFQVTTTFADTGRPSLFFVGADGLTFAQVMALKKCNAALARPKKKSKDSQAQEVDTAEDTSLTGPR